MADPLGRATVAQLGQVFSSTESEGPSMRGQLDRLLAAMRTDPEQRVVNIGDRVDIKATELETLFKALFEELASTYGVAKADFITTSLEGGLADGLLQLWNGSDEPLEFLGPYTVAITSKVSDGDKMREATPEDGLPKMDTHPKEALAKLAKLDARDEVARFLSGQMSFAVRLKELPNIGGRFEIEMDGSGTAHISVFPLGISRSEDEVRALHSAVVPSAPINGGGAVTDRPSPRVEELFKRR